MAKQSTSETQQQHTARMLRWQEEDAKAFKEGRLRPLSLRPELTRCSPLRHEPINPKTPGKDSSGAS